MYLLTGYTFILTIISILFMDKKIAIYFSNRYVGSETNNLLQRYFSKDKLYIFFKYISKLGEGYLLLFLVLLFGCFYYMNKDKKYLILIKGSVLSFIISGLGVLLLKVSFGRERPYVSWNPNKFYTIYDNFKMEHFFNAGRQSFPSGHTITTFAFITFICLNIKNNIVRGTLIVLGFLIAFSRIYLSYHWLSDVIMGVILGYFIGIVVDKYSTKVVNYKKYSLRRE